MGTVLVLEHSMVGDELASAFGFKVEVVERCDGSSNIPKDNPAIRDGGASPVPLTMMLESRGPSGGAGESSRGLLLPPALPYSTPSRQASPLPPRSVGGSPVLETP